MCSLSAVPRDLCIVLSLAELGSNFRPLFSIFWAAKRFLLSDRDGDLKNVGYKPAGGAYFNTEAEPQTWKRISSGLEASLSPNSNGSLMKMDCFWI
ncbi:hypothetical protein PoB_004398600 [Plakobranchus ocellatus]|uniref:Uncharacterized protein n=1 Tax=Plakobranchus ocellatus TaxID=259542 RepID=A0AAV4BAQ1_9GAST|nr:hypothetical protein PoB_004398600 [Plakobranchus ocellatus]